MSSVIPGFAYTLRISSRAKHLRIAIRGDGSCTVTVPRRIPKVAVEEILRQKSSWITETIERFKKNPHPYSWQGTAAELKKYKVAALQLAQERLYFFNQLYGFHIGAVSIRNQKTRWGSCSSRGRINFSYKIALLPPHLADYIIVHELCHLGEMNHSPRFWTLVAQALPEYRQLRHELRYGRKAKSSPYSSAAEHLLQERH